MNSDILKIRKNILQGLKLTYKRLIEEKIAKNQQLVVSENGKVVHVDPRKFKTEEE